MIRRVLPRQAAPRRGAAAVEFAFIGGLIMIPILAGLWELGRAITVQQIVANSARDGARLAAQGRTVNSDGATTDILAQRDPINPVTPNVKSAVYQSLVGAGLTQIDFSALVVEFQFNSDPSRPNPSQGLKSERFSVKVTLDYDDKVHWVDFALPRGVKPDKISYTVDWEMMTDDPFRNPPTAIPYTW